MSKKLIWHIRFPKKLMSFLKSKMSVWNKYKKRILTKKTILIKSWNRCSKRKKNSRRRFKNYKTRRKKWFRKNWRKSSKHYKTHNNWTNKGLTNWKSCKKNKSRKTLNYKSFTQMSKNWDFSISTNSFTNTFKKRLRF